MPQPGGGAAAARDAALRGGRRDLHRRSPRGGPPHRLECHCCARAAPVDGERGVTAWCVTGVTGMWPKQKLFAYAHARTHACTTHTGTHARMHMHAHAHEKSGVVVRAYWFCRSIRRLGQWAGLGWGRTFTLSQALQAARQQKSRTVPSPSFPPTPSVSWRWAPPSPVCFVVVF